MHEDRAWAAGFFDGEGNVCFTRPPRRRPRILVQIAQVNPGPLVRFQQIVGVGTVTGPYAPRTSRSRPYYRWAIEGYEPVRSVWTILGPWLCDEKQDAFGRSVARYQDWLAEPRCWQGHATMKQGRTGRFYCQTCTSQGGKRAMEVRWG